MKTKQKYHIQVIVLTIILCSTSLVFVQGVPAKTPWSYHPEAGIVDTSTALGDPDSDGKMRRTSLMPSEITGGRTLLAVSDLKQEGKKQIIHFPGNILNTSSPAQSFTDTNRIFSQYNAPSGCPAPCQFITTFLYRFAGDTLIDTLHYRKILFSKDSMATWEVTGFARETREGKVYFRKKYSNDSISNEGLTYDFSLLPGDTMYLYNPFLYNYRDTCILTRLDTVEMFDSVRKVFHMRSISCRPENGICYGEEVWIEGIGSLTGLLLSGFGFNPWVGSIDFLLCVHYGDYLIYSNPDFDECYYNTTAVPQLAGDDFKMLLSPNPVTDVSFLKLSGPPGTCLLEIYTQAGRLLQKRKIPADGKSVLRAADFNPGLYFFRVTKKDGGIFTGKFIVIRK
ncbi:MAG: T9SS type A sorting domain-containing protein [Bacteroidales bacterium]|nr:T9SS type A sorting domain-containing protein [Bacteroidales bacterium]